MSRAVVTLLASQLAGPLNADLNARADLYRRLRALHRRAQEGGAAGPAAVPPPAAVAETHRLFVRATFRPAAAAGFEYTRTQPRNAPERLAPDAGGRAEFGLGAAAGMDGHFLADQVLHVRLAAVPPVALEGATVYFRYCALPGLRVVEAGELYFNQSLLIERYEQGDLLTAAESLVPADKREALRRLLGQAGLREAHANNRFFNVDEVFFVADGAQTPKPAQPALDLWIPLVFWYNREPAAALCNARLSTPASPHRLAFELAPLQRLLGAATRDAAGRFTPVPLERALPGGLLVEQCELFTRNVYLTKDVLDTYLAHPPPAVVRLRKAVARRDRATPPSTERSFELKNLRFAVESLEVTFEPERNQLPPLSMDKWWAREQLALRDLAVPLVDPFEPPPPGFPPPLPVIYSNTAYYFDRASPVADCGLLYGDQELYARGTPAAFFTDYLTLATPALCAVGVAAGVFHFPFAQDPFRGDPSGYANLSETNPQQAYLTLVYRYGPEMEEGQAVQVRAVATTLNLLVYDGDRTALKYT